MNRTKQHDRDPTCIQTADKQFMHHANIDIANEFNTQFAQVGQQLARNITPVHNATIHDYLHNPVCNSMYIEPVSEADIISIVNLLKSKQSEDYLDLSMYIVKNILPEIVKPLCYIFNLCITNGVFPSCFKIAKIIPIFKKR